MFLDQCWLRRRLVRARAVGAIGASLIAGAVGCADDDPIPEPRDEAEAPRVRQARARLRGPDRYVRDLATALDLSADEVCTEVGDVACADAHRIALGGTDAYGAGVYHPLPLRSAATVAAYDRIALSACDLRVERDLAAPSTESLFGLLATDDEQARREVASRLYRALLRREASEEEVTAVVAFDVSDVQAAESGRAFAVGACFAVATSIEALFY